MMIIDYMIDWLVEIEYKFFKNITSRSDKESVCIRKRTSTVCQYQEAVFASLEIHILTMRRSHYRFLFITGKDGNILPMPSQWHLYSTWSIKYEHNSLDIVCLVMAMSFVEDGLDCWYFSGVHKWRNCNNTKGMRESIQATIKTVKCVQN